MIASCSLIGPHLEEGNSAANQCASDYPRREQSATVSQSQSQSQPQSQSHGRCDYYLDQSTPAQSQLNRAAAAATPKAMLSRPDCVCALGDTPKRLSENTHTTAHVRERASFGLCSTIRSRMCNTLSLYTNIAVHMTTLDFAFTDVRHTTIVSLSIGNTLSRSGV